MTIDKSLRVRAGMIKSRNVLTRAERIEKMKAAERWTPEMGALGLPKTRVQKIALKKKKKAKVEEGAAEGEAAATPAAEAAKKDAKK